MRGLPRQYPRECLPDEVALLSRAQQVAESLAELAPLTLWATKESLRRIRDASLPTGEQQDLLLACYLSNDYREATAAFMAKRTPVFHGR